MEEYDTATLRGNSHRALIFGISGQDGAYLSKLLLSKGYEVYGTSRDAELSPFSNLTALGIRDKVCVYSVIPSDFMEVMKCVSEVDPTEVYNLSGQTSVGLSFFQPHEAFESITVATLNMLESLRFLKKDIRFFNACSGECFGGTTDAAKESTPLAPKSPYAVAKAASLWQVSNYRNSYALFVCSGILFNHESPLRPSRFVTKKIVDAASRIASGSKEKLLLGNMKIRRDWGWAPEYVEAMWLMLQQESPGDLVISTGEVNSLEDFVSYAFDCFSLDWKNHVRIAEGLFRPSEVTQSWGDPAKAEEELGWRARKKMTDVVSAMIQAKQGEKF